MPLYEYSCSSCGHSFEETLSLSRYDEPCQSPCSECGEMTVTRGIGGSAIVSGIKGITHKLPQSSRELLRKIKKTAGSKAKMPDY